MSVLASIVICWASPEFALTHGSSGGPLLDLKGQALGVNSYPGFQ